MSLIEPTAPQTVEQAAGALIAAMNALYGRIVRDFKKTADRGFWHHPNFTPTEIAAALGPRGLSVFQASAILETALEALSGEDIVVADPAYTIAPDVSTGIVVITPISTPDPEPTPFEVPTATLPA